MKNIIYFMQYILLRIIAAIIRLFPLDTMSDLFGKLAQFIGPFLKVHKLARQNIYDHLTQDEKQIEQILRQMWNNLGRYIVEFITLPHLSISQLEKRITIEGLEHIENFLSNNQPMLMMGGHFANWECAIKLTTKKFAPLAMVYRRANNPFIDQYIIDTRNIGNINLIEKGQKGVRNLTKALKNKQHIAMLIDQRMNDGIAIDFLGEKAMTAPAIAKIAQKHKYPIVPMRIIRTQGSNFILRIYPAMDIKAQDSTEQIMLQANQIIAQWVKDKPGQWFWLHNRWGKARNSDIHSHN